MSGQGMWLALAGAAMVATPVVVMLAEIEPGSEAGFLDWLSRQPFDRLALLSGSFTAGAAFVTLGLAQAAWHFQ